MYWLTMSSVLIQLCLALGSIRFCSANYIHGLLTERRESPQCTIEDVIDVITKDDLVMLMEEVARREDRTTAQLLAEFENILGEIQQTEELKRNIQTLSMRELLKTVGELPPFFPKLGPTILNANSVIKDPHRRYPSSGPRRSNKYHPPEGPGFQPFFRQRATTFRKPTSFGGQTILADKESSVIVSPMITFLPPPGVIVQVSSEGLVDEVPDVTVTVSPLMTVVEALRQADFKLQRLIETPNDIFSFKHSPLAGCYVVESIGPLQARPDGLWKVEIVDKQNKVVYNSVCLPSGKEVIVKPGMKILLSYQPTV